MPVIILWMIKTWSQNKKSTRGNSHVQHLLFFRQPQHPINYSCLIFWKNYVEKYDKKLRYNIPFFFFHFFEIEKECFVNESYLWDVKTTHKRNFPFEKKNIISWKFSKKRYDTYLSEILNYHFRFHFLIHFQCH